MFDLTANIYFLFTSLWNVIYGVFVSHVVLQKFMLKWLNVRFNMSVNGLSTVRQELYEVVFQIAHLW